MMIFNYTVGRFLLLALQLIGLPNVHSVSSDDEATAQNFFRSRNWIPHDDCPSSPADQHSLVGTFQKFAGIPVTGRLDETTVDKMNSARCGNPDFGPGGWQNLAACRHQQTKWPERIVTWHLIMSGFDTTLAHARLELIKAFQAWEQVSRLQFVEEIRETADINIHFSAVYDRTNGVRRFDGPGGVRGFAFYPGSGSGGDIHFDVEDFDRTKSFTRDGEERISFYNIALHEIGHSLGLWHSKDSESVMSPFFKSGSTATLKFDDIAKVQALYGWPTINPFNCFYPKDRGDVVLFKNGNSDRIPDGNYQRGSFLKGDFITARCADESSLRFNGPRVRRCLEHGWDGQLVSCEQQSVRLRVRKSPKETAPNGTLFVSTATRWVSIACEDLEGRTSSAARLYWDDNGRLRYIGQWTLFQPSETRVTYICKTPTADQQITRHIVFKDIRCPAPPNVDHGNFRRGFRADANVFGEGVYLFRESVRLECNHNHLRLGSGDSWCNYEGEWAPPLGYCSDFIG